MARRIAIAGLKGGCGRTTIAVNLASALALRGRKTLLVDLDPQAAATLCLGVEPGPEAATVYELLIGQEDNLARAVVPTLVRDLHLLPSVRRLYGAELELADEPDRAWKLSGLLDRMDEGYSLVIVDCPSSFGLLTLNALCACPEALVPVHGSSLSLAAVEGLMEVVEAVNAELGVETRVAGLAPNMVDKRTGIHAAAMKKIEGKYGKSLVRSRIRLDARLPEASAAGKPIQLFAPKSNAAYDFEVLADDMSVL
ncbi:MAG: ParA family protein [Nitrospinota bacterium]|nr:ParA family protein [Nitrospinota bacterium]